MEFINSTVIHDDVENYINNLLDLLLADNTYSISHGAFYNVYNVPHFIISTNGTRYADYDIEPYRISNVRKRLITPNDLYKVGQGRHLVVDDTIKELYKCKFLHVNNMLVVILIMSNYTGVGTLKGYFTILEYSIPMDIIKDTESTFINSISNRVNQYGLNNYFSKFNDYLTNEIRVFIDNYDFPSNSLVEKFFRYLLPIDINEYTFDSNYDINNVCTENQLCSINDNKFDLEVLNRYVANTYLDISFDYVKCEHIVIRSGFFSRRSKRKVNSGNYDLFIYF